jgi:hypothetical protein
MKEETAIRERIYGLIDRMSKRIGIQVPKGNYPSVKLEEGAFEYRRNLNEFALDPKYIHEGEPLGEEIAHFIRDYTKTFAVKKPLSRLRYYLRHPFGNELDRIPSREEGKDIHSDEFFGYLGRRILKEIANEKDNLRFGSKLSSPKEQTRADYLHHARPYKFARQTNLSQISDFNTLFSLPDRVVRSRFFRSDPQYDLSKPVKEAKITKRNPQTKRPKEKLESLVRVIAPIFLLLAIILVSQKTITGNAINNLNFTGTVPIVVILIIALVFVVAAGIKRKR